MGRLIGIDYGSRRIGLAVTDSNQIIASPMETYSPDEVFQFFQNYLDQEEVEGFVVGLPTNLDGSDTDSTPGVRQFVEKLKKKFPQKAIHLQDERFTSKMALDAMIQGGMKKKKRREKGNIDKISAAIILQLFLESSR